MLPRHSSILSDSPFDSSKAVHGGCHRTQQIEELTSRAGLGMGYVKKEGTTNNWAAYVWGFLFMARHMRKLHPPNPMWLRIWRMQYVHYRRSLVEHAGPKVVIWENTIRENWIAPHAARAHGFNIIGCPQNIESLVRASNLTPAPQPSERETAEEARHLSQCNEVFCIADEDRQILEKHGTASHWLPYHPPENLSRDLLSIRQSRQTQRHKGVLMLGTVLNPPTREGMLELIGWLGDQPSPHGEPVHIAGMGTETLQNHLPPDRFVLHGTVSADKLRDLLSGTRCVILHQKSGTGALTRIPEMLTAGIPLVANTVAARSATHHEGVHVFRTREEMFSLLNADLPVPKLPSRPEEAEHRFIDVLRALTETRPIQRAGIG